MTVSELQLQFIRLYKEMDATYYQLAAAQELSPSEWTFITPSVCWEMAACSGISATWR